MFAAFLSGSEIPAVLLVTAGPPIGVHFVVPGASLRQRAVLAAIGIGTAAAVVLAVVASYES